VQRVMFALMAMLFLFAGKWATQQVKTENRHFRLLCVHLFA
jgi:hypothetical protein